jgi:hypothetical protein
MFKFLKPIAAKDETPRRKPEPPKASKPRQPRPLGPGPLPEVTEGNSQADWELWEDSVAAFDSQFASLEERFRHVDPFATITKKKP